jgi:hypothetical protein
VPLKCAGGGSPGKCEAGMSKERGKGRLLVDGSFFPLFLAHGQQRTAPRRRRRQRQAKIGTPPQQLPPGLTLPPTDGQPADNAEKKWGKGRRQNPNSPGGPITGPEERGARKMISGDKRAPGPAGWRRASLGQRGMHRFGGVWLTMSLSPAKGVGRIPLSPMAVALWFLFSSSANQFPPSDSFQQRRPTKFTASARSAKSRSQLYTKIYAFY